MTLRHRLLLVYLIVVLLSVATVGVAIYELNRTQNIYGPLQIWHEVAGLALQITQSFPPPPAPPNEDDPMLQLIAEEGAKLNKAAVYLDVDIIRGTHLFRVRQTYLRWRDAAPADRPELAEDVQGAMNLLLGAVESQRDVLIRAAEDQQTAKWLLPGVAIGLGALNVMIIGWLLRRWLIAPMERLNRQVEALAKDQPPPEPLLTSPLEMASLAAALDRARQSLQVYRLQLIDNERLTTIGQFAAQLAHNLRNPLASIRAAAQVTARHERGSEYVRERMDEVVACVDRLNRWVAGLMEVARREPTPAGSADVVPLLHRIHDTVRPDLAIKELSLCVEAPAGGLMCVHDPATLEQALIAMVVNAIEASPMGRTITLRAAVVNELDEVEGAGESEGGMERWGDGERAPAGDGRVSVSSEIPHPKSDIRRLCRISVIDEGPGLPVDHPERIFDFSYSTKQKGMGLGLSLARLALERQGGQARACNRPEGGAMVYVDLPIAQDEKGEVTCEE